MYTTYELKGTTMEKPAKLLTSKMVEIYSKKDIEKDKDFDVLQVDDLRIPITYSVTYIISALMKPNFESIVAKRLNADDIESLIDLQVRSDKCRRIYAERKKRKDFNQPLYGTKTYNISVPIIEAFSGNSRNMSILNEVIVWCNENRSIYPELLGEAIALAILKVVIGKDEIIVNPFNLHCIILYHWACKKFNLDNLFLNYIPRQVRLRDSKVEESDTIFDTVDKLIKTECSNTLAKDYIRRMNGDTTACCVYYDLIERFIDSAKEQVKISSSAEVIHKNLELQFDKAINNELPFGVILGMLDKEKVTDGIYLTMSAINSIEESKFEINWEVILLWVLKEYYHDGEGEEEFDEEKSEEEASLDFKRFLSYAFAYSNSLYVYSFLSGMEIVASASPTLVSRISSLKASLEKEQKVKQSVEKSLQTYKDRNRELTKTNKKLSDEVTDVKKSFDKLKSETEHSIRKTDMDKVEAENNNLKQEIQDLKLRVAELDRLATNKNK